MADRDGWQRTWCAAAIASVCKGIHEMNRDLERAWSRLIGRPIIITVIEILTYRDDYRRGCLSRDTVTPPLFIKSYKLECFFGL